MGISVIGVAAGGGGGRQPREQYFYSSGTWVVPEGVTSVEVTAVGGGGSSYNTGEGAYGGAGGVARQIVTVVPQDEVSVVVGAAAVNTGSSPNLGGLTSFGNSVVAAGGEGAAAAGNNVVFGGVFGQITDENGMDYCIPQYPVGNTTVAESYGQKHTAAVAGNYAFISLSTNSWEYTYIPDPSIRGNTGNFQRVAYSDKHAHVKYGDGYYYFWHDMSTNSTYHSRIAEPATPAGMTGAAITYFTLPSMREYVPAFDKLIMPKMDNTSNMFVSDDRGDTWTTVTATITGATSTFESYTYLNEPHWDGNFMVFVTQSYWYTSSDGVNFVAHDLPYGYNNSNSGFVNKVGPRTYVFAAHHSSSIYYKTVEFNETYTSFNLIYSDSTSNIANNASTNLYNPGKAPYGWTAYQNYNTGTWACFGGDARGPISGYHNAYTQTSSADPRQYTFSCKTAYDYATNVYVGVYDYGSTVGGYMVRGAKAIGRIPGFNFQYSGSGNGGIGAGGKGAIAKWVSTYERTLHSPGPGLYGFSNGAGNGVNPGTGAFFGGDSAQNGIVLLRWWQ